MINNKIIIKFNGDFWHANPKIYEKTWQHPILKESALSIWEHEKKKLNRAKALGYKTLIIWESDFKQNKEKTLLNVFNFIKKINESRL